MYRIWLLRADVRSAVTLLFRSIVFLTATFSVQAESPQRVVLQETKRKLIIIPLYNKTGESYMDYLSRGIPRMIRKRSTPAQVRVAYPSQLFMADPSGQGVRRSTSGKGVSGEQGKREAAVRLPLQSIVSEETEPVDPDDVSSLELVSRLGGDYVLYGSYSGTEQNLRIEMILYNGDTGQKHHFEKKTNTEAVYQEIQETADLIKHAIEPGMRVRVSVSTDSDSDKEDQSGALVYMDDVYLGRTPVMDAEILPGRYTLSVEKRGFKKSQKRVRVHSQSNRFRVKMDALNYRGKLRVTSDPPGSRVYLNATYLGKTPLLASSLQPGAHRVRISHKGYVDRFRGIEIEEDRVSSVHVEMSPGDTQSVYLDPNYVILDWSHEEMAIHSAITGLVFYGGYGYSRVHAKATLDRGKTIASGIALFNIPDLSLYQFYRLEQQGRDAAAIRRKGDISGGLSALSLVITGYFLWRGVYLDEKEAGELPVEGWFFSSRPPAGAGGVAGKTGWSQGGYPIGRYIPGGGRRMGALQDRGLSASFTLRLNGWNR